MQTGRRNLAGSHIILMVLPLRGTIAIIWDVAVLGGFAELLRVPALRRCAPKAAPPPTGCRIVFQIELNVVLSTSKVRERSAIRPHRGLFADPCIFHMARLTFSLISTLSSARQAQFGIRKNAMLRATFPAEFSTFSISNAFQSVVLHPKLNVTIGKAK